jgi:hypothetical protein
MPPPRGTLANIAGTLATLLSPLTQLVGPASFRLLLADLGLQFPPAFEANPALVSASEAALQRLRSLPDLLAALDRAIEDENVPLTIAKALETANAVRVLIQKLQALGAAIKVAGAGAGIPPAELNQFADTFADRLLDYLVVRTFESVPGLAESLEIVGAVERTTLPAVDAQHPEFTRRRFVPGEITNFIQDPAASLRARFEWGAPGFNGLVLLQTVHRLLTRAGVPAVLDTSGAVPVLDVVFLEISPKLDIEPKGLLLKIVHPLDVDTAAPFVQDDWQARIILSAQLNVGLQATIQPNDGVTVMPMPGAQVQGDMLVEWTAGKPDGDPYIIVGEAGASRLEARQLIVRAGVGFAWNAALNRAEGTFTIAGEVKHGKLAISLAGADGFIGKILGGFKLESEFGVGLGYSTKDGLVFQGSATLDIQLPLHVQLGPVELSALTLTVGIENQRFPIGFRTDLKAALGPLRAVVEQIGAGVDISLPADRQGNAGPVDLAARFLPPRGVGLSLDAGIVSGGGYLFFDPERGEYAGALELTFSGFLALKAIGIITTRMPDGSTGFSLLLIITAEFGTGIQLGFGFTLLAVGGLIGLNRTMNLQPLMEGIRTGSVNSIMFPRDVVANAPRIISDLRAIFPPREGTFLIGPMAKLGWGTPTLVSVSLGIVIEIPGNIAILGVLKVAIPADDVALIVLQVNFAGAIEFDRKRIFFFAALFESRIVFLTIEGEMGLLIAYGDDANFVLSVGGFHPQFNPPPLPFPSPNRVSVSLLCTPLSRVRIEGYFAVTSNTVQFGARVEIFFGLDALNVQGHLAFDALFQFSPFYFIIEISASFSVKVFGAGLFSVRIRGSLDGPAPWHIKGHGSISLLFWSIGVDFETTWGERRNTEMPPIAVMALLDGELRKNDAWRAVLPAAASLLVSLRRMPPAEAALVLHPLGVLRVSQRAAPLEIKLDKIGSRAPADTNRMSLAVTGDGLAKKADALEPFAPAQFQNFSDSDKLSKPAFAPERAGVELSAAGADVRSSVMVKRIVRYEETIIDSNYKRFQRRFRGFLGVLFNFFLQGAAVSRSELSKAARTKLQPFDEKIGVAHDTYSVAFQSNNRAFAVEAVAFQSEASAREYMNGRIARDPGLADAIHVIPDYERAA